MAKKVPNAKQRVNNARVKIRQLVRKGHRINLNKASNFTVNEIAKAAPHPQSGAAHGQQRKRGQVGYYTGKPYGHKDSGFRKIFNKTEDPWKKRSK